MIESYLAAGALPFNAERADHAEPEERTDEFAKRQCAGGIEEQWLSAIDKLTGVRRCQSIRVGLQMNPSRYGAGSTSLCHLPDLQHNKLTTSEGMKGVSDLDRSQRLTGPMCSSKQPTTVLYRLCRFCRGNGTRRSPNTAMGSDRGGRRIMPWLKRSSSSRKVTDG
jgi:hypothetical protein